MKKSAEIVDIVCDNGKSHEDLEAGLNDSDPLEGLGLQWDEKFYSLNVSVFAEPLQELVKEKDQDLQNEFKFFDKVTVEKIGKRKKYHVAFEYPSELICPQENCKKEFSSMTLLRGHIRKIHCAEHNFICEYCSKSFTAKYLLERHKMVHENKVVECPICCKKLSGRTNLSVHMKSHSNTRQHKCGICDRSFVRKCTLDIHVKFVHNKELKCEICDERFEKRNQLARHVSSHKSRNNT